MNYDLFTILTRKYPSASNKKAFHAGKTAKRIKIYLIIMFYLVSDAGINTAKNKGQKIKGKK